MVETRPILSVADSIMEARPGRESRDSVWPVEKQLTEIVQLRLPSLFIRNLEYGSQGGGCTKMARKSISLQRAAA